MSDSKATLTQDIGWLAGKLAVDEASARGLAAARLADAGMLGKGGMELSSAAFMDGGALDPCFTAQEEDAVAPPLEWSAPPAGAMELALIVEAPAASGDATCHWVVWGLAAQKGQLLEGEVPPRVGKNALGNSEWLLPNPAPEDAAQTYVFQLFALDLPMTQMPGATRDEILQALDGHVVGLSVLTATYKYQEREDWDDDWMEEGE